MNRPQKNKIKNPTLPEDQQIDERNLIDAEESEDISVEDRIHMYWVENKAFISGCITVIALVIIGLNGMRIYAQHSDAKLQEAYAEAMANEALEVFAKEYSNKTLGGLAALAAGDTFYTSGNFDKAVEYYAIAAEALENDVLNGRSRLGLAFSTFYKGDKDAGLSQLNSVAADIKLPESIRAEAAYHLAVEADVSGDRATFESYAAQVSSSELAGQWQQRMQMYQQQR
ncbi:MAG: tetratricopeptide repeat protein [Verrucomicrobiota bacterium]